MDAVHAHTSCQMAEQFVIFGLWTQDFDSERGVWKGLYDHPDEFDNILRHRGKPKKRNRKSRGILATEIASSKPWGPKKKGIGYFMLKYY